MKVSLSLVTVGILGYLGLSYGPGIVEALSDTILNSPDEPVPTLVVKKSDVRIVVPAGGELLGLTSRSVRAPSVRTGSLRVAWLLEEGTIVEEGQPVVRFDDGDALLSLEESRNQYSRFESRIDISEEDFEGLLEVLKKDQESAVLEKGFAQGQIRKDETIFSKWEILESIVSAALAEYREKALLEREELQETRSAADLEILEIDQEESSGRMTMARETLSALQLRAPASGILLHLRRRFEKLEVGAQVWSRERILEIVSTNRYRGRIEVQERDISGVSGGAPATVTLDAFPGRQLSARVAQVARVARQINRADPRKYFSCDLLLEVPDDLVGNLKPGLKLSAEVEVDSWENAVLLPRSALIEKSNEFVVFVAENGTFREQPVEIVATDYGFGVVEGLEAGQVVSLRHPFEREQLTVPDFSALAATQGRRFEFEDR